MGNTIQKQIQAQVQQQVQTAQQQQPVAIRSVSVQNDQCAVKQVEYNQLQVDAARKASEIERCNPEATNQRKLTAAQEEYKKLFSNSEREKETKDENSGFHKDFEDSLEYFNSLVEKEKETEKENLKNTTLKNYNENPNDYTILHINPELPNIFNNIEPNHSDSSIQIHSDQSSLLHQSPKYGCLKNGVLPT